MQWLAFCSLFIGCVVSTPAIKYLEDVRIVGGEDINIKDAPYQVSILRAGIHHCGGSIIAQDIIVTAAHCVYNTYPQLYKVRVGSSYNDRGGQVYSVADLIWHPNFTYYKLDADVAILKLAKPIVFNDKTYKIEMADEHQEIRDGDLTTVTGWGATTEDSGASRVLQKVNVRKMNQKKCSDSYISQYSITARMFCAGIPGGGKDSCQGDSGGPLVYQHKLSGIVSWGIGCARPEYPGVYAKVSALRRWIDYNIVKIRFQSVNIWRLPL